MFEKRVIHKIWKEWDNSGHHFKQITGKWQYLFSSKKGTISCVEMVNYFHDGVDFWEIFSLKGDLFEDVERYDTFEKAKVRCTELLL